MFSSRAVVWLGLGLALVWLSGARASIACEPETPSPEEPTQEEPVESVTSAVSVRLNEILPVPSSGEEFVELEVLDEGGGYLHGWALQDASGKVFTFDQAEAETHADQFFVLYSGSSKLALNNTGDRVDLINPQGEVTDSAEYGAAEADLSWSRFTEGWDWGEVSAGGENVELAAEEPEEGEDQGEDESDDGDEREDDEDSPDEGADEETGLTPVTQLRLNELLPNPEGDESTDEWIELLNEGEGGTLLGWSVTDGKSTYAFPDIAVEVGELLVVGVEDSGIGLNNTGDVVYVVGPDGEIVQGVEYGDAPSGQSFARFDEAWEWTDQVTPGEVNVAAESAEGEPEEEAEEELEEEGSQTATISLAEVRSLEKGTEVVVNGVVGVEPGPLGAQVMYIQDETGGMQVYSYQKDFPADVMRGSLVSVTGITSTAYGEVRVNADEGGIVVLEQQDEVLPKAVSSLDVEDVGELVVVEGTVESKSASRVLLDSGIEVYIKSSADISLSDVEAGSQVRVVGVVSQYNDTLRMMPREQSDVVVVTVTTDTQGVSAASAAGTQGPASVRPQSAPPSPSTSGWVVLGLAGGVIILGSLRSWWKKKRVAKRLFKPYTEGHESQRSTHPGGSVSVQLPPGTRA
ncbi:MAG: lamin tail domain-containing protein [Patescibacteria group bacterium]